MNFATTTAALAAALALVGCSEPPDGAPVSGPASAANSGQLEPPRNAPREPRPEGLVRAGANWELVAQGYIYTDSPVALEGDAVLFAAPIQNHLYRVDAGGAVSVFDQDTEHTMGLVMGSDGFIYGCRNRGAQIVRYASAGAAEVLLQGEITPLPGKPSAPGEFCNDVAVAKDGKLWFTDRVNRRIMLLTTDGAVREVASGFRGNGIVLSADGTTLAVTDSVEPRLWAFEVAVDGSLVEREGFFGELHTIEMLGTEDVTGRPGTNGMTVDSDGRYYVASFYGIQVYAPDGDYIGVIDTPKGFVSNLVFAGANRDWLYASGTNGLWRLPMQVTGAHAP